MDLPTVVSAVLPYAAGGEGKTMRMMTAAAELVSTAALADTTTHYTVLFQDRPSGSQVTTVRADGQVDVDMSYRDNGRGPDIREHARYAPDGSLVALARRSRCCHRVATRGLGAERRQL